MCNKEKVFTLCTTFSGNSIENIAYIPIYLYTSMIEDVKPRRSFRRCVNYNESFCCKNVKYMKKA